MAQIIPLTNSPNQTLLVALSVNTSTIQVQLKVRYSEIAGYWLMTVANSAGSVLADSIPMITGTWPSANILAPFETLRIGSAYMINVSNSPLDSPDDTNLGSEFLLVWDNN